MSCDAFNAKYQEYLEHRFEGLEFDVPEFTKWLDEKFQVFIQKEGFQYSQIKMKFGTGRFYCKGLTSEEITEVENKISEL